MRMLSGLVLLAASLVSSASARDFPADPLNSPMWDYRATRLFGADPVRFDPRVKIIVPVIAEDQHRFPVAVDARGIEGVLRILIFADLNPIPLAVDYRPVAAQPYIETRIKLDQRTPVRGAVQLASGEWLVSGTWVDAAGGGCSAPPLSRVRGDWADHLGEMRGGAWSIPGQSDAARLRISFRHPMDTGLVENIASYYIDHLSVRNARGMELATLEMQAAISEDPSITVLPNASEGERLILAGRDTGGRTYAAIVTVERAEGIPPVASGQ